MAGFLPDFHQLQLRGISAFPILRLGEYFRKVFSRIITSDDPQFFLNFRYFEGSAVVAGFLPDSHQLQLRGVFTFPILRHYEYFPKSISRIITCDDPNF